MPRGLRAPARKFSSLNEATAMTKRCETRLCQSPATPARSQNSGQRVGMLEQLQRLMHLSSHLGQRGPGFGVLEHRPLSVFMLQRSGL